MFLRCISYTNAVNIITLSGTHQKREPFGSKGSDEVLFSSLCSFLYILDMTGFSRLPVERRMYKKPTFYTYASTSK